MDYLASYFAKDKPLVAKSIVVEPEYVDRAFMSDHAAYYSSCFQPVPHTCKRLHFFQSDLDLSVLERLADGDNDTLEDLRQDYLGFVVLKPLVSGFVGRTVLRTYPEKHEDGSHRGYTARRPYSAHILGCRFDLESLAFQEQDYAVAECATTAVWSALQQAAHDYRLRIPSPADITREATMHRRHKTKAHTAGGLTDVDIVHALRTAGASPEWQQVTTVGQMLEQVYAYGEAHIPGIVGAQLFRPNGEPEQDAHAFTIAGYRIPPNNGPPPPPEFVGDLQLTARRITRLYAHDDNAGPFSGINVEKIPEKAVKKAQDSGQPLSDLQYWLELRSEEMGERLRAAPLSLIFPLHRKVRVSFEDARAALGQSEQALIALVADPTSTEMTINVEWNLRLRRVTDLMRDVREGSSNVPPPKRFLVLQASWPRFIWQATALRQNASIIELWLDATAPPAGPLTLRIDIPDGSTREVLRSGTADQLRSDMAAEQVGVGFVYMLRAACS